MRTQEFANENQKPDQILAAVRLKGRALYSVTAFYVPTKMTTTCSFQIFPVALLTQHTVTAWDPDSNSLTHKVMFAKKTWRLNRNSRGVGVADFDEDIG